MKNSIFNKVAWLSGQLETIDFWLFTLLKIDLGDDYLFVPGDLNLLIDIQMFLEKEGLGCSPKKDIINRLFSSKNIISILNSSGHCDPYELFIDAGRIDVNINTLLNNK